MLQQGERGEYWLPDYGTHACATLFKERYTFIVVLWPNCFCKPPCPHMHTKILSMPLIKDVDSGISLFKYGDKQSKVCLSC